MRTLPWIAALGLVSLLGGCGGSPPPPPAPTPGQPGKAPAPAPPAPAIAMPPAPEEKPLPPIPYAAKGRRDPFRQPPRELEKGGLTVASMKLVGVLQGRQEPMALVEGPDGLGYILRAGETIADGRVIEIGTDSVTFSVAGQLGQPPTRMVLRLKAD